LTSGAVSYPAASGAREAVVSEATRQPDEAVARVLEAATRWFATLGYTPFPFQTTVWTAYARGESGLGVHLAGQGARLARAMPAAELVATLAREIEAARATSTALA